MELLAGTRFKTRNGQTVRIVADPWLPSHLIRIEYIDNYQLYSEPLERDRAHKMIESGFWALAA